MCLYTSREEEASCWDFQNREHKSTFGKCSLQFQCSFSQPIHTSKCHLERWSSQNLKIEFVGEGVGESKFWHKRPLAAFSSEYQSPWQITLRVTPTGINTHCVCVVLCCAWVMFSVVMQSCRFRLLDITFPHLSAKRWQGTFILPNEFLWSPFFLNFFK